MISVVFEEYEVSNAVNMMDAMIGGNVDGSVVRVAILPLPTLLPLPLSGTAERGYREGVGG